ncbi:unnamed protein product [Boreogadus saida]
MRPFAACNTAVMPSFGLALTHVDPKAVKPRIRLRARVTGEAGTRGWVGYRGRSGNASLEPTGAASDRLLESGLMHLENTPG